ncbi:GntR family transcriptional regulator [Streptomyces parvus]|uniref:GntR family transcriptional regulator n=1 Tax=Streptomyces parvus TaxID=66428 RepID=UPI0035E2532B
MPEVKSQRPPDLPSVQLPGLAGGASATGVEALIRQVKEGLRSRRYSFGDVLPPEAEIQELYGMTGEEAREGIRSLRREGYLQLHDDYGETYILDPGIEDGGPEPTGELGDRVVRLEALCAELMARLSALESQLASRARTER